MFYLKVLAAKVKSKLVPRFIDKAGIALLTIGGKLVNVTVKLIVAKAELYGSFAKTLIVTVPK